MQNQAGFGGAGVGVGVGDQQSAPSPQRIRWRRLGNMLRRDG